MFEILDMVWPGICPMFEVFGRLSTCCLRARSPTENFTERAVLDVE